MKAHNNLDGDKNLNELFAMISTKQAVDILKSDEMVVSEEQAKIILIFMFSIANRSKSKP